MIKCIKYDDCSSSRGRFLSRVRTGYYGTRRETIAIPSYCTHCMEYMPEETTLDKIESDVLDIKAELQGHFQHHYTLDKKIESMNYKTSNRNYYSLE